MAGESEHTIVEVVTDDMPFLVDSVTAELNRRDLTVHLVVHPILRVRRDPSGRLEQLLEPGAPLDDAWAELFIHVEVTRQADQALAEIAAGIEAVLADVRAAVGDRFAMRAKLDEVINGFDQPAEPGIVEAEREEAGTFLRWLRDNHFTFLGYRALRLPADRRRPDRLASSPAPASACCATAPPWFSTICATARRCRLRPPTSSSATSCSSSPSRTASRRCIGPC